jgi:hypothetical protein
MPVLMQKSPINASFKAGESQTLIIYHIDRDIIEAIINYLHAHLQQNPHTLLVCGFIITVLALGFHSLF